MQKTVGYRDCLTNELLLKRFTSQFDLVRYAISLAEARVHSGKEGTDFDIDNPAFEILAEIAEHRDHYADVGDEIEEDEEEAMEEFVDKYAVKANKKGAAKKKTKR